MPTTRTTSPSRRTTTASRRGAKAAAALGARVAIADALPGTTDELRQLKLSLMATREKLMLVSPDVLNDLNEADHNAWETQKIELNGAINALRNASLESLSADFRRELPDFSVATKKLEDDLFALQNVVAIIRAVGSTLGIITKIVKLAS